MTILNGLAQMPMNLKPTERGEVLQLTQMHSKFLAHQRMMILSALAHQAIDQQKGLYTWTTPDGKEEEMDALPFFQSSQSNPTSLQS